MKKWLFNPFIYIAGAKALIIGWAAMLVTAVICYFSKTHFDGVIDVHTGHTSPMLVFFLEVVIDWGCPVAVFYITGRIFSTSSIRLIDIAGTFATARWVMIFPALAAFGVYTPAKAPVTVDDILRSITPSVIVFGLFTVLFAIWMIALMYSAFTTSCNLKGGKAVWSFIIGLIIAEVLSKLILHTIY